MAEFEFGGEIVWRPTPEYVDGSHLQRFMQQHGIESWHELYERSVEDVAWFTEAMLTYLDKMCIRDRVIGLAHGDIALAFFLADGDDPNARVGHAKHIFGINAAHYGELLKIGRLPIGIGADVHEETKTGFGGKNRGQGWPVNASLTIDLDSA